MVQRESRHMEVNATLSLQLQWNAKNKYHIRYPNLLAVIRPIPHDPNVLYEKLTLQSQIQNVFLVFNQQMIQNTIPISQTYLGKKS